MRNLTLWLQASGDSVKTFIDCPEPDIDKVNTLLELFGRELFRAGRPYNHYAETLNAVSSRRPRLRRCLQQAWNLASSWLEEPGFHHVALRTDTRFKAARHQVASVDQPQLVHVIELASKNFAIPQIHSGLFRCKHFVRVGRLLEVLGMSGPLGGGARGLDLGSLRAGGATWLLQQSEDSEFVRRRGRWLNSRTMEIYIQEALALQFLPTLKRRTRKTILHAVEIFPLALAKLPEFDRQGIQMNAWRLLLCG